MFNYFFCQAFKNVQFCPVVYLSEKESLSRLGVEKKAEDPVTVAAVDVTVETVLAVVAVVIIDEVLDVDLLFPEAVEATVGAVVCSS